MRLFNDMDGNEISGAAFSRQLSDIGYRRVGEAWFGEYVVSTVLLGWDAGHGWAAGPLTFETAVMDGENSYHVLMRYGNRWDALVGHMLICVEVSERYGPRRLRGES